MKKKRGQKKLLAVLILLLAALAVVAGVTVYKEHEYRVSENYYQGLRMEDDR